MRILHVYKEFYPVLGGIENHVRFLGSRLAREPGIEVTVLVTNRGSGTIREQMDGVEVIRAGRQVALASTPLSFQLVREMARIDADVTHLHFPYPWGELAYLLAGRGRLILTYHSDVVRQRWLLRLYAPALRRILAAADRIIVTSPQYLETSVHLRPHAAKCVVIPHGVDLARFRNVAGDKVSSIRARYGQPLVLFVGRLRYYKGLDYLVAAAQSLQARVLIVGAGPEEERIARLIRQLGLEGRVILAGDVADDDLPAYYQAADVFVLPASERSEAFGIVQLEAMAAGRPLVCTELGTGTSYVNVHGETGLVVPPRDPPALAAALNELLSDPQRRARMGEACRARVEREFSADVMVRRIRDLYTT